MTDDTEARIENLKRRIDTERFEQWREWIGKLPWLPFPAGWQVRVIPPFGEVLVRFLVKLPDGREKSVYFDPFCAQGYYKGGQPYWEVSPVEGSPGRCDPEDVAGLLRLIEAAS
jgi:hypothetical protein